LRNLEQAQQVSNLKHQNRSSFMSTTVSITSPFFHLKFSDKSSPVTPIFQGAFLTNSAAFTRIVTSFLSGILGESHCKFLLGLKFVPW
jgi:hypothetical protein